MSDKRGPGRPRTKPDKPPAPKRELKQLLYDVVCGYCGKTNVLVGSKYRHRIKQSKSGHLFCDHSCSKAYWYAIKFPKKADHE